MFFHVLRKLLAALESLKGWGILVFERMPKPEYRRICSIVGTSASSCVSSAWPKTLLQNQTKSCGTSTSSLGVPATSLTSATPPIDKLLIQSAPGQGCQVGPCAPFFGIGCIASIWALPVILLPTSSPISTTVGFWALMT